MKVRQRRIKAIAATEIDAATFTGGWQELVSGLVQECFLMRMINASDVGVDVSFDGATLHDHVLANTVSSLDLRDDVWAAKGVRIYVRAAAGIGRVIVSGYYY